MVMKLVVAFNVWRLGTKMGRLMDTVLLRVGLDIFPDAERREI